MFSKKWNCVLLGLLVISSNNRFVNGDDNGDYMVGVGIADVTGPSAELGMMGYAALDQSAHGIHTRLFARAFIIGEPDDTEGRQRVVFVSSDIGMVDQAIKTQVVEDLAAKGYGEIYHAKNVLLSGTHTHSGPGGYIQYVLYGITSLGFMKQNFDAIVHGIVASIERAHNTMQTGKIYINKGNVEGANINRSPTAYENNPATEKEQYPEGNVDKQMTLLKFVNTAGEDLGSVNWFAVHPTSMNNTNKLISGDNKGYAEMQFEYKMNPDSRPGQGKFVAAFAASNLGDVSPNIMGPRCINTGLPCDDAASTCNGWTQMCIAIGPGTNGDMVESTEIIGNRQYLVAQQLYDTATEKLTGPVQFKHQYVNMTNVEIVQYNNVTGERFLTRTCPAALGYSFAAGTTDGPGAFDFHQGDNSTGNDFWNAVRDFLHEPSEMQVECQRPKPILLDVGESYWPYEWSPSIVETQVLRVGNLFINGIPGELTTMSGRRVRRVVRGAANANGIPNSHEVIAGLSNVYTHYITTPEEYDIQRYEGASTIYGRNTLPAYMQQYEKLVDAMLKGEELDDGPTPPNLLDRQISLVAPIVVDTPPFLMDFGHVLAEPANLVLPNDTVTVDFAAGHPRNEVMREGTFLLVERQRDDSPGWDIVATDGDWSTKFEWKRPNPVSSESIVTITWKVPGDVVPGFYRIRHFGYYKPALLPPRPYQGETSLFQVASSAKELKSHPNWSLNKAPKKRITTLTEFWNALFRKKSQRKVLTGETDPVFARRFRGFSM